jgi:hypothetical protein
MRVLLNCVLCLQQDHTISCKLKQPLGNFTLAALGTWG